MKKIGTATSKTATKILLCGSGELGKEVAIEFQRYGVEVIALDRYDNAPAMQVAHRAYTVNMLDGDSLRGIIEQEQPDLIIPEIEALDTATLASLEQAGFRVIPTANATQLTMNREGIRTLASKTLGLPTSSYAFADDLAACREAVQAVGFPCFVKPVMSSSGKGQSILRSESDIEPAWGHAQSAGRSGKGRVIIEGFVDFDYEITLLTVRHRDGTSFCEPIGHRQEAGDYRESWQPQPMSDLARQKAETIARVITDRLGGFGLFGVELFVKGDEVIFSEVSPRPHDTGLVTLISQNLSEFALHVRAVLGLPIPMIEQLGPSASAVILAEGQSSAISFFGLEEALQAPNTEVRLFGKPSLDGHRRLGVALAKAEDIAGARLQASATAASVTVVFEDETSS
ncbi:MAG: formate-dependent phosphoribosylglycinamide formyltransferase [Gammaproteobacteria bacterium]|nr:formate-dependent phosphoribosylglycinamide formyltransferase [Gammaproteobacteria bacterium]MBT5054424.1 formate-dependent phosphoribosylglycinamide formyltransferase [Gammaproteobacteria bacterium]